MAADLGSSGLARHEPNVARRFLRGYGSEGGRRAIGGRLQFGPPRRLTLAVQTIVRLATKGRGAACDSSGLRTEDRGGHGFGGGLLKFG
jgi:hypothetical protein